MGAGAPGVPARVFYLDVIVTVWGPPEKEFCNFGNSLTYTHPRTTTASYTGTTPLRQTAWRGSSILPPFLRKRGSRTERQPAKAASWKSLMKSLVANDLTLLGFAGVCGVATQASGAPRCSNDGTRLRAASDVCAERPKGRKTGSPT